MSNDDCPEDKRGRHYCMFCALFHDLLLRSYLRHCVWSVITAHSLTPEKLDNNYAAPSNPHFVPPKQHSIYSWHLALLWVSVMHTLTRSSITVNKVSATF